MTREAAARFSFLLATPITLGAGLYGSRKLLTESHTGIEWLAIGVGFAAAAVSGCSPSASCSPGCAPGR